MTTPQLDLKDYRQPMVTSIGIILGFLISFLGNWVTDNNFRLGALDDKVIFFGSVLGAVFLFVALFRMLNVAPATNVLCYYKRTLFIYITGVILAFASIFLSVFF